VAVSLRAALEYLVEELLPRVGSVDLLREKHLAEALDVGIARSTGLEVAVGKVISIPGWRSLGRSGVDLAVVSGRMSYPALLEAKWCHSGRDKIYEGIWDLFKMALGLRRSDTHETFLVTGAPAQIWRNGFCADLFAGGEFTPEELCSRMLPWGRHPRWLAWDDLLYGGYDRFPEEVPAVVATHPLGDDLVLALDQRWVIRAIRVSVVDPTPVSFIGGWPLGSRPANARHPK
jgi:hypothetical protein